MSVRMCGEPGTTQGKWAFAHDFIVSVYAKETATGARQGTEQLLRFGSVISYLDC